MSQLILRAAPAAQPAQRNVGGQIVGNAWVTNITHGKNKGLNGLTISFNRNVTDITGITSRTRISLFPNNNRRAGRRDPEYLAILQDMPEQQQQA